MRDFDPRKVGRLECTAWVTYYQRRWLRFLAAAISLTRQAFGLSWPATMRGAWLVLRANQLWAPFPDNDPGGARRCMRRFYQLAADQHGEAFDVEEAARLEVEWWRVHRELQHDRSEVDERPLADAIAALYAHVYGTPAEEVAEAAAKRALAMRFSDQWIDEGQDPQSPLIAEERATLVSSYASLLAAVHRP